MRQWISAGELSKKARVNAFGVDISENMIASARERYPDCTFTVGPCAPLGFENESMDVITVSCAFHHFENPRTFAGECMRVLKSHGKVFIAEPFLFSGGAVSCQHAGISLFQ
ncbi:class I SAM-dependent methyltransferase [Anaerostipes caccae]|uniref:class I SAM-dependent methyltransferase n=1 Tax=Anaerostipes caccae TaxID=105841 RepID=UPI002FE5E052